MNLIETVGNVHRVENYNSVIPFEVDGLFEISLLKDALANSDEFSLACFKCNKV